MGGGSQVLEDVYPELKGQRELYDQISSDLNARGLFNSPHFLHTTMSAQGMVSKRTTPLADRFLDFITSPVDSIAIVHEISTAKRSSVGEQLWK